MDTILFNLQKKKKIWPPTTRWPRRCSMPRAAKEFSSKLHHIKIQGNKVCVLSYSNDVGGILQLQCVVFCTLF